MDSDTFRLPGEHVYNGVYVSDHIHCSELAKIKLLDLEGDTVIVSYPNTGMFLSMIDCWNI
jgi:hypothetical protein